MDQENADEIAPLAQSMVRGRLDLGVGNVISGSRLAAELAVDVGERLVLRAVRPASSAAASAEAVVVVRGKFTLGVQATDERVLYIELGTAKKLFHIQDGVSIIELKVDDVWQAPALADRLARATQLKASSWLERNALLWEGLPDFTALENVLLPTYGAHARGDPSRQARALLLLERVGLSWS